MIEVTHPPTQGLLVLERKRQNALGTRLEVTRTFFAAQIRPRKV